MLSDKTFQPFFTTKPTWQACPPLFIRRRTGLGLSLSYAIVKAHEGELKVETLPAGEAGKEARPDDPVGRCNGSEFIIHLPIKTN